MRAGAVSVALVVEPHDSPVACPEIHDLGIREQRNVQRVVWMVVGQKHVGHGLGFHAELGERRQDCLAVRDHARIDDEARTCVEDEADGRSDSHVGDEPGVEQVEAGADAQLVSPLPVGSCMKNSVKSEQRPSGSSRTRKML